MVYFSWAQGMLTGINLGKDESEIVIVSAMTAHDQLAHIRNYCDEHPLALYAAAVVSLFNELPKRTLPANSK